MNHLHAGDEIGVVRDIERKRTQRCRQVVRLLQRVAYRARVACRIRRFQRVGDEVHAGVSLRRYLVRINAVACPKALDELLIARRWRTHRPRAADDQPFRGIARAAQDRVRVEGAAADNRQFREPRLACLDQDRYGRTAGRGDEQRVGLGRGDRFELCRKVGLVSLERLLDGDVYAGVFERCFEAVRARAIGIGVAVEQRGFVQLHVRADRADDLRRELRVAEAAAKDEVADLRDAAGGVRDRHHRYSRLLGDGIDCLRGVRERRAKDGNDVTVFDEALEYRRGLLATGAVVVR